MPKGAEPEMHSINDFAYTKRDFDYLNAPLWRLHDWLQKEPALSPVVRIPNFPVKKAFRTCSLIRGRYPYALVIDDIQKDDTVHHYDWNGLLEADLRVDKIEAAAYPQTGVVDVTMVGIKLPANGKAPEPAVAPYDQIPAGEPLLLIRLLSCNYDPHFLDRAPVIHDSMDGRKKMLTFSSNAVSPDFKVLIYPYRKGDPLPATTWNADHSGLTVSLPGQQDVINFSPSGSGKTNLTVTRPAIMNRVDVNHPIPPLPDRPAGGVLPVRQ
jgi:hypothetical protein